MMTIEDINKLIADSMFADIGFIDANGSPSIRRVFCTWHKGVGKHLISTNTSSMHVQALLLNPSACLYFENSQVFEGVCFQGKAIVHIEKEYKEKCWKEGDEQYYPKGVTDDNYCIIEFTAESGRYYRYDGIGNITKQEMDIFDQNTEYVDNYDRLADENM